MFSQLFDNSTAKENFFTLSFLPDFPRLIRLLFLKSLILKLNAVFSFKDTEIIVSSLEELLCVQ